VPPFNHPLKDILNKDLAVAEFDLKLARWTAESGPPLPRMKAARSFEPWAKRWTTSAISSTKSNAETSSAGHEPD
jgi:hypothetical protein